MARHVQVEVFLHQCGVAAGVSAYRVSGTLIDHRPVATPSTRANP